MASSWMIWTEIHNLFDFQQLKHKLPCIPKICQRPDSEALRAFNSGWTEIIVEISENVSNFDSKEETISLHLQSWTWNRPLDLENPLIK